MPYRENTHARQELHDIVVADVALMFAFSLVLSGGVFMLFSSPRSFFTLLLLYLPISAVAVSLSFVLHELMHKFVAQYYGAIAGFRTSYNGLVITLLTGAFGFLFGVPGATMIYASSFSRKENGLVSLAGPLTNVAIFAVFVAVFYAINHGAVSIASQIISPTSYVNLLIAYTVFISLWLAFFNMLPIPPLDGSKVMAWNMMAYIAMIAMVIGLLFFTGIIPEIIPLTALIFVLFIAVFFSFSYRSFL